MAEVKFNAPIQEMRGSLGKESPYYYRHRNGKTYLCCKAGATEAMKNGRAPYKAPKPKKVSPAQMKARERFQMLQKATREICSCPTLRAWFEAQYQSQHKVATLQGFIIKSIKNMSL